MHFGLQIRQMIGFQTWKNSSCSRLTNSFSYHWPCHYIDYIFYQIQGGIYHFKSTSLVVLRAMVYELKLNFHFGHSTHIGPGNPSTLFSNLKIWAMIILYSFYFLPAFHAKSLQSSTNCTIILSHSTIMISIRSSNLVNYPTHPNGKQHSPFLLPSNLIFKRNEQFMDKVWGWRRGSG